MKKKLFTSLLLFACVHLLAQDDEHWPKPKLSAATSMYLWKQAQLDSGTTAVFPEYVYRLDEQQHIYVSVLIKVHPGFQAASTEALGAHIGTKAGMIWTVQVPLDKMHEFCLLNGIEFIETDRPAAPSLDTARVLTRVDSVHEGYLLPQPFSGKNVVVGIVDAGFDYTHPTFYDTSYTHYRIKRVWEEKNIVGPAPVAFGYGTEFNDSNSIITRHYDILDGTHGTHVAGIAAGCCGGNCGFIA
jgi:minor extracellular serine protease Vpr